MRNFSKKYLLQKSGLSLRKMRIYCLWLPSRYDLEMRR
nr:MAG TPA: hypothetical protein [Caudoviricetes sp.]DAT16630.1 MAG TPA: hypothetical protein [Caudoviricetes sp.]DAW73530.1 MAG TPA: hypothetical protein [Caudoviricetes sp.]DAX26122.1 MAG TPA: hypothetical protein [Caudoviricetes sp.]